MLRYFEDFPLGQVVELGSHTVTQDEIIAFARDYDPQPFHTDPLLAAQSSFGGIVASGWHSVGIFMRLLVDALLKETAGLGSPGVDEIRWLKPVRPGDTLSARTTFIAATPSRSKPDRGVVKHRGELANQHGEIVMTLIGMSLYRRRPV
jgi:acyl dehydratase